MRYWLTATLAVAITIAGGWFVLLNPDPVSLHASPSRVWVLPLGATLLAAFLLGAAVVGLFAAAGALSRGSRTRRARRRSLVQLRAQEALERAEALAWSGERSSARAALMTAPQHVASAGKRIALLAETYLQDHAPETARSVLAGAPPDAAGSPRILDLKARADEALGDRAAAIDALERARRAAPSSPRLVARLRDLYAADGRWNDAAGLETELWLGPSGPNPLAGDRDMLRGFRYQAAMSEADPHRAARALRTLAEEAPEFVPAWVSAGDRLVQDGRSAAARRIWLRGLRHRLSAVLLERIAALDEASGEQERTVRLFERLSERHPGDATIALHLAKVLLREGRPEQANEVLDRIPAPADALAARVRGVSVHRQGDIAAAADSFVHALGPDLGLTRPWRCGPCGAAAPEWSGRCGTCGRWNTLLAPPECITASDLLIQDAKRSQPDPR